MGELVSLRWPSHNKMLSEGLWNLFRENYQTDFELCANNDVGGAAAASHLSHTRRNNASLVIHRLIMAIFCPSIKDLTEPKYYLVGSGGTSVDSSCGETRVVDGGGKVVAAAAGNIIDEDVLRCLIEFVYRGKIEVAEEKLSSLKWGADQLGIKVLVDLINTFTLNRLQQVQKIKERNIRRNMRRISKRKGQPVKISKDEAEDGGGSGMSAVPAERGGHTDGESQDQIYPDCKMEAESRSEIDNLVSTILLESEVSAEAEEDDDEDDDEDPEENETDDEDYVAGESDADWSAETESKRYKNKRPRSGMGSVTRKKLTRSATTRKRRDSGSGGGGAGGKDSSSRRWRRKLIAECFDSTRNVLVCKYCDKGFKDKGNFIHHVRCHENPNLLFQCTLCDHKSVGRHTLMEHMASKHHVDAKGNPLERNIKCHQCPFTCFANFQLKNHIFQKHSKPFTCDKCNYSCASTAVLTRHVKAVHDNERPFMCETCGYRAKTMLVFKRHLKVHSGKKIVCDICGLSLTHQSFRGHMKLHLTDERPHPCHLCSFAARKRYSLKVHLKNVHKLDIETMVHLTKFEPGVPTSSSSTMPPHMVHSVEDTGQQHLTSEMCMSQLETIHQMSAFIHTMPYATH